MKIEKLPSWPDGLRDEDQALLTLRAARLKEKRGETLEEAQVWLAAFAVGALTFALPLERVRAAVPLRMVTPVPLAPSYVLGVLRFRGTVSTVLSLASLLGVRGWKVDPAVLLIIDAAADQRTQERVVAIDCEQIPRAISLSRAIVEAARSTSTTGPLTEVNLPDLTQLTIIEDIDKLTATAIGARRAD